MVKNYVFVPLIVIFVSVFGLGGNDVLGPK